jgi:hypothetical protein
MRRESFKGHSWGPIDSETVMSCIMIEFSIRIENKLKNAMLVKARDLDHPTVYYYHTPPCT